jgi:dTDP-4-amino-4,6-dideoxygalactose transaminase
VRSGATPVFVDIDPDTFNIDPKEIKKAITKNTIGILPVHLYGLASGMGQINKIAKAHNLFVVEDAAQSFGGAYKGKKLGTLGTLGAFSFFPSKNLGSFGDAGLVATNDKKLAEILIALRNHGQSKIYNASFIGYNSRLDSIQAAVLLGKIKYVDKFNKSRRKIANNYNKALKNIKQIQVPSAPEECYHVYNLYTIKVKSKRDKLLKYLNSKGIAARIYYPLPLNKMKAFRNGIINGKLTNVYSLSKKVLSLPGHPFLSKASADYVIEAVKQFYS